MPPTQDVELDDLIARADLDGLIRLIEARTSSRDWDGLLRLRNRAHAARETGRQLWPAATLAEYRLALWGGAKWAAAVLDEESGRFAIGPLAEVAAQRHSWAEVRQYLDTGPRRAVFAHERVLRGEFLDGNEVENDPFELPLRILDWEPNYLLATYTDDGLSCDPPSLRVPLDAEHGDRPDTNADHPIEDADIERAARQVVETWTASSNGRFEFAGAIGDRFNAANVLGVPGEHLRFAPLTAAEGIAWLAWAGASGGAHGRRRGAAAGRFAAWWLIATIGGFADEWPPAPAEVGDTANELRWWWWDASEPATGWALRLALEDPFDGVTWLINATDAAS